MSVSVRDALRAEVVEKLMGCYENAQKVAGGFAFMSDKMDEETGLFIPVVVTVTAKNTAPTARSEAYDIDKAVAKYAAKPGRRVADPAKIAERAAAKEAAASRKQANLSILRSWVAANPVDGLAAKEIYDQIPELQHIQLMQVGVLLTSLVEDGTLTVSLNDKRKKIYHKA